MTDTKHEYPKWLYKDGEKPVLVADPDEHKARKGWSEAPGGGADEAPAKPLDRLKKADLLALADELGLGLDDASTAKELIDAITAARK